MNCGKRIRFNKIFCMDNKRAILVPLDHGVTIGPAKGISNIKGIVQTVLNEGANGVILHKGLVGQVTSCFKENHSLIVHMSASTNIGEHVSNKVRVCTVAEAIALGADAVSIHANFGTSSEPEQIRELAEVAKDCNLYGIPLIVMAYVRGKLEDEYDAAKIAHAARISVELGADIVKCNYTGDTKSFRYIIDSCNVPVLIAGGPNKNNISELFSMVYDALNSGAAGLSIGRNIFEHQYPNLVTRQLKRIVQENITPDKAYLEFEKLISNKISIKEMIS